MNTAVIEFLKVNPGSNKAAITEATGIKGLPLFNLLKQMLKDEQITSQGEGSDTTYAITEIKAEVDTTDLQPTIDNPSLPEATTEQTVVTEEKTEQAEQTEVTGDKDEEKTEGEAMQDVNTTVAKETTTRDNTKFSLNGQGEYGKGPLVRAVIELHLKKNPTTTFKQLKEVFPDSLMKRFGVFEEVAKANEISGKRDRYFTKAEHVITLGDKKQIVVCSQWTSKLIVPFIEAAKKAGYKISKV